MAANTCLPPPDVWAAQRRFRGRAEPAQLCHRRRSDVGGQCRHHQRVAHAPAAAARAPAGHVWRAARAPLPRPVVMHVVEGSGAQARGVGRARRGRGHDGPAAVDQAQRREAPRARRGRAAPARRVAEEGAKACLHRLWLDGDSAGGRARSDDRARRGALAHTRARAGAVVQAAHSRRQQRPVLRHRSVAARPAAPQSGGCGPPRRCRHDSRWAAARQADLGLPLLR
mmetsp:Transcript_22445/g.57693  ORF Transcript_22445/g.57693 Transcript_22445/m.57693 type:complete len:227 (-) Transcript_22445:2176-2856(-)